MRGLVLRIHGFNIVFIIWFKNLSHFASQIEFLLRENRGCLTDTDNARTHARAHARTHARTHTHTLTHTHTHTQTHTYTHTEYT